MNKSIKLFFLLSMAFFSCQCDRLIQNGVQTRTHNNGQIKSEYTYKNGQAEGPFKEFNEAGNPLVVGVINAGEVTKKEYTYYFDGVIETTGEYAKGKRNGVFQEYYRGGILHTEETYQNDRLEGPAREYLPNGTLESEKNYKNNKLNGIIKEYVDGKLYRGVVTGFNKAFVINTETRTDLIAEDPRSAELIKPFLAGRDVKRYQPPGSDRYLFLADTTGGSQTRVNIAPAATGYIPGY